MAPHGRLNYDLIKKRYFWGVFIFKIFLDIDLRTNEDFNVKEYNYWSHKCPSICRSHVIKKVNTWIVLLKIIKIIIYSYK